MKDCTISKYSTEALKIIDDFLPEKLFDAHMHISHLNTASCSYTTFQNYYDDIKVYSKNRIVRCNGIVFPEAQLKNPAEMDNSVKFVCSQLDKYTDNVAEIMVLATDTVADIEKRLVHKNIRGLKCYCIYAKRPDNMYANIEEYLPEAAWVVANEKKLAITLHLVKDEALSHPNNLNYIIKMAKKYPDAILILAHAARAFAAWTVFDVVDKLVPYENVWFDFSAICESPAMLYILKKIGAKRCMWGTDYPICLFDGKAVSIADKFHWIPAADLNFNTWNIMTEGFMAMRQTAILADLNKSQIEDIFYNNANKLFFR
ncbi:MAG: amidohydrolase family protein [Clostridia bacterium]|nr:amidohydrolase family protein [Clostridia bacterium]